MVSLLYTGCMKTRQHQQKRTLWIVVATMSMVASALPVHAQSNDLTPHLIHDRHTHHHNPKHRIVLPGNDSEHKARFFTDRASDMVLPLPEEKDAYTFVVFGDRTGGPADGVNILADAVRDTNLFEPDFVMTVGDLVQGYNTTGPWIEQMHEYKAIMDELRCPWFPVAGNHDIYWRGEGRPPQEHETEYEMYFGPLWYAFSHKNSFFIVLYSDEGNPQTGERAIGDPAAQVMSQEQFDWLKSMLAQGKDAEHVFLFLHHPRWLRSSYGDDWDKVHEELVKAGNVTAVFAGHIHRMRYDPRDGIEYVSLATVGGGQDSTVPDTGWLHQYNIVTVRKDQVAMASVPVGGAMNVREITGEFADEAANLASRPLPINGSIDLDRTGSGSSDIAVKITNPTRYPIEVSVVPDSADSRWVFQPDHRHAKIEPGATTQFGFAVGRHAHSADTTFRVADIAVDADILAPTFRYAVPTIRAMVPMTLDMPAPTMPAQELAMRFDGNGDYLEVPSANITLPDGPMTLECWFNPRRMQGRTGLLTKTENSEYGFFVGDGTPSFSIFLGDAYVDVAGERGSITTNAWHHIAGVYDGNQVRLYLDGKQIASQDARASRRSNDLPLLIGADVTRSGAGTSYFNGQIDEVRVSTVARYHASEFPPTRRFTNDADTAMLIHMDGAIGPWTYDESGHRAHPFMRGNAELVGAK